jgi:hypothetical protein
MKNEKETRRKVVKSSLKAATASVILAGSLLSSNDSAAAHADGPNGIRERVKAVKAQLEEKLARTNAKLSYSETELTQWGNWGNWGNWNNWVNWNNWNNWRNWGNWGNWRNR